MNKIVKLVKLQTGKGLFHHRAAITRTGFDRQGLVQPWALWGKMPANEQNRAELFLNLKAIQHVFKFIYIYLA